MNKKYNEPCVSLNLYVPQSRKEEIRELVRNQLSYIPYEKYHALVISELKNIGVYTYSDVNFKLDWFSRNEPKDVASDYKDHLIDTIGKEHQ